VADEESEQSATTQSFLESSEPPGGAVLLNVEGIHAFLVTNLTIKVSLFHTLPPARPNMENGEAKIIPRRSVIAHLFMDKDAFVNVALGFQSVMKHMIDTGEIDLQDYQLEEDYLKVGEKQDGG
jgi:hypothetical protein